MADPKREVSMCAMNGCDRHVECPRSGLCKRCYSWMRYQIKHAVSRQDLMERLDKYKFWDKRLTGYVASRRFPRNK